MAQGGGRIIMKLAEVKKAMASLSAESITDTNYKAKGYHLDVKVAPDQVVQAVQILDQHNFFVEAVTGVDWLGEKVALQKEKEKAAKAAAKKAAEEGGEGAVAQPAAGEQQAPVDLADELEVVYDFNCMEELCRVVIRSRVPRDNPEIQTISEVFPGANWHERETHDFFGIRFIGHPSLIPLLLPEDADFHPLLKDFHV